MRHLQFKCTLRAKTSAQITANTRVLDDHFVEVVADFLAELLLQLVRLRGPFRLGRGHDGVQPALLDWSKRAALYKPLQRRVVPLEKKKNGE